MVGGVGGAHLVRSAAEAGGVEVAASCVAGCAGGALSLQQLELSFSDCVVGLRRFLYYCWYEVGEDVRRSECGCEEEDEGNESIPHLGCCTRAQSFMKRTERNAPVGGREC
jgi:hypothetical protein